MRIRHNKIAAICVVLAVAVPLMIGLLALFDGSFFGLILVALATIIGGEILGRSASVFDGVVTYKRFFVAVWKKPADQVLLVEGGAQSSETMDFLDRDTRKKLAQSTSLCIQRHQCKLS